MPNLWDFIIAALFAAVWPIYTYFIEWPQHVKRVASGDRGVRVNLYRRIIAQEWAITAAIFTVTLLFVRPIASLGLRAPQGWRLALAIAVPLLYGALLAAQVPAIARKADLRTRMRGRLQPLAPLIPTRPLEWAWFKPLAVTAGICEEIMFRGYLVWVLTPFLGLFGAAGLSMVVFGLGHGYQGGKFGFRAFGAGALLGLLALATGSIVPGIVLHALIDLGSGYVTYQVMREPVAESAAMA